jgi:hypothetical protein
MVHIINGHHRIAANQRATAGLHRASVAAWEEVSRLRDGGHLRAAVDAARYATQQTRHYVESCKWLVKVIDLGE